MLDVQPANDRPSPNVFTDADPLLTRTTPLAQVSKIPQAYAAEVMRRHAEHGWSMRDISKWLTKDLQQDISYGSVSRFIHSQRRKAALEDLKPFYERMMAKADAASEELDIKNAMLDETSNELSIPNRPEAERAELREEHTRLLRDMRVLVSQFNAYSRHIPKPPKADSPVVRGRTGDLTASTKAAPTPKPEAPSRPAPASAPETDSPAVRGCTGDLTTSTKAEAPKLPVVLPMATVISAAGPQTFRQWLAAQPTSIELDPSWASSSSTVIFVDLSKGTTPLKMAVKMLQRQPKYEPRMVFVLPPEASDTPYILPTETHPPITLPLTPEKVNAALQAVETALRQSKEPLLRAG